MCRALLSEASLVLMDESTSALDTINEALMYRLLRKSNMTYVSVGHRPTLLDYHDRVLRLQANSTQSQASFEVLQAAQAKKEAVLAEQ